MYARRSFGEGEFLFRRRHTRLLGADDAASLDEWERVHVCQLGPDRLALAPPGCYLSHACDPNAMRHGVKVFAAAHRGGRRDHDRLPDQRLRGQLVAVPVRHRQLHRNRRRQLLRPGSGRGCLPHARRSSGASTDAVFGPCAPVSDEPAVAEWDDPEPAVAVPLELHLGAPLLVQRHGAVAQLVDQACPLAGRRPATAPGRPRARGCGARSWRGRRCSPCGRAPPDGADRAP